jgi:4-hydroxy-4-methyl-2-oxoglutarate aldolase
VSSLATTPNTDPYEIAKLFKYLRVSDVSDAMDFIGYFGVGLMDPDIRPLWMPMHFYGPAITVRAVPAHRPMWALNTQFDSMVTPKRALVAHGQWANTVGATPSYRPYIRRGSVLVMDDGGAGEVGHWGSSGSMLDMEQGVVGFVTNGYIRDTYEVELHKTPMCCRKRGRTIDAGRMETIENQVPIGCGGVQVRPGDIVVADNDGVIVVPQEVAEEVARYAVEWVLTDMGLRREYYVKLGLPFDETVDVDAVAAYYRQFEK